jgi:transposase InsO family protein
MRARIVWGNQPTKVLETPRWCSWKYLNLATFGGGQTALRRLVASWIAALGTRHNTHAERHNSTCGSERRSAVMIHRARWSRWFEPGQYTSKEFTDLLADHQMTPSLSRPRQCWDNAVAESWFATLKVELIERHSWATRAQARRAIFEFIEVFYNRQRLHSSLD